MITMARAVVKMDNSNLINDSIINITLMDILFALILKHLSYQHILIDLLSLNHQIYSLSFLNLVLYIVQNVFPVITVCFFLLKNYIEIIIFNTRFDSKGKKKKNMTVIERQCYIFTMTVMFVMTIITMFLIWQQLQLYRISINLQWFEFSFFFFFFCSQVHVSQLRWISNQFYPIDLNIILIDLPFFAIFLIIYWVVIEIYCLLMILIVYLLFFGDYISFHLMIYY